MIALGVFAIPLSLQFQAPAASSVAPTSPAPPRDPRVTRLHKFFRKLDCPVAPLSEDFVRAADANGLDWRLLPSIAVIESGGGKDYRNNNIFGWDRGDGSFVTIKSGLELVAYKLGRSPLYRRHGNLGKLRIYNQHEEYAPQVLALMRRISPS